MAVRAVRGATQLEEDDRDHMLERVAEMVLDVMDANGLEVDDFISVIFTATSDLVSEFPAYAARQLGFGDVPAALRPRARDRAVDAAGGPDARPRRDRPAARRHHPRLPARRRGAAQDLTRVRAVPDE